MDRPIVMTISRRTAAFFTGRMKTSSISPPSSVVIDHRQRRSPAGSGRNCGQADGRHRADDQELALGEVDDPGGVVDDVEPDGDDGVDAADGDPREAVLNDLGEIHRDAIPAAGLPHGLRLVDGEFAVLHRQHLKGVHGQAVVVLGEKLKMPAVPTTPLRFSMASRTFSLSVLPAFLIASVRISRAS